jgi:hypothetical protein
MLNNLPYLQKEKGICEVKELKTMIGVLCSRQVIKNFFQIS